MYVCNCEGITESDIKEIIASGVEYNTLVRTIKNSGWCCKCLPEIKKMYQEEQ